MNALRQHGLEIGIFTGLVIVPGLVTEYARAIDPGQSAK
jgi:hypothetical protein